MILSVIHPLLAQENIVSSVQTKGTADPEEEVMTHTLYTGIGYGNNMVYLGSSITQDKPYYSGFLMYGYKEELFVSISSCHLSAFDPLLAFNTLSLNYFHDFNSWFDISAGLSGYQVNSDLADTLFSNFTYGDLSLGFDWKILYTSISAGGILAEESSTYFQLKNSRYFETGKFMSGKVYISIDPYFNMLFGTLTKTVSSEGTIISVLPPYKTGKSGGRNSSSSISTIFSLIEMDFGFPVAFNAGRFTIQAEPAYILPPYSDTDSFYPKGFIFMLNCFFRII